MEEPKYTLTRQELYDLVWSVPIRKLAKQYGMSDRGFAKACQRHLVPVPGRGHWAKVAAGLKSKRTPLPVAADPAIHNQKTASRRSSTVSKIPGAAKGEAVQESETSKEAQHQEKSRQIAEVLISDEPTFREKKATAIVSARSARGSVDLDDMVAHDDVLEKYTWLSGHILNRWKRTGAIRFFRGAKGTIWYPKQDLNDALIAELSVETPKIIEGSSSSE
jgi:hypothetical protein